MPYQVYPIIHDLRELPLKNLRATIMIVIQQLLFVSKLLNSEDSDHIRNHGGAIQRQKMRIEDTSHILAGMKLFECELRFILNLTFTLYELEYS